ncbi:MAG TPA: hypothetical protein PL009_03755 [Flavipsychrobacter sp.]|nr:hypothetical protein [Flavipsychrobacter sp.]
MKHKRVLVEKVSDFYISGLENSYIKIHGIIIEKNGERKRIKFKMVFEKAIAGFPGHAPEIIVPEKFKPSLQ